MELYAPSESYEVGKTMVTEDGLMWTGMWDDMDDMEEYAGSTVF
jgi:hypothetical protein